MALTAPDATVPVGNGAAATVDDMVAVLKSLQEQGVPGSNVRLTQGGLRPFPLSKPAHRDDKQQALLADHPAIRHLFEALKLRAYQLLVASGRDPDKCRFDKLVWLLSVLGNADQAKHFDDMKLLKMLYYPYATAPTNVTMVQLPTLGDALRWIEDHESCNGAKAHSLLGSWPFAMVMRWLAPLVAVMQDPPTKPPVKVVNCQSAMLVEPGVVHHSPAPPFPGFDPMCEGRNRGSVLVTIMELPEDAPVVRGSFLAQELATLHTLRPATRQDDADQQFTACTAAYYTGCSDTMFQLLRSEHRMKGDESLLYWAPGKRDKAMMEAAAAVVAAPAAGCSFTSSGGLRRSESTPCKLIAAEQRFVEACFSKQRELLPMD